MAWLSDSGGGNGRVYKTVHPVRRGLLKCLRRVGIGGRIRKGRDAIWLGGE